MTRANCGGHYYSLASEKIEADGLYDGMEHLMETTGELFEEYALVSQCYTESRATLLIQCSNPDVAFIRWTQEKGTTGLIRGMLPAPIS